MNLDFDGDACASALEHAVDRGAHRRVGHGVQSAAVRHPVRVEMFRAQHEAGAAAATARARNDEAHRSANGLKPRGACEPALILGRKDLPVMSVWFMAWVAGGFDS